MTNLHQKKQDEKHTIRSILDGVAKSIAIGSVAITTIALKDEKSRESIKKVLINVRDQAKRLYRDTENRAKC